MKISILSAFFWLCLSAGALPAAAELAKGDPAMILPKAHLLNQTEILAGETGEKRACRADVRSFGRMLWQDHKSSDRQVMGQLEQRGISPLNVPLDSYEASQVQKLKAALEELAHKRGCAFDRPFLLAMRDAHVFAIQVFQAALATATDPQIRSLVQATLPALQSHLAKAEELLGSR
jgi:predicted outer membrane protein